MYITTRLVPKQLAKFLPWMSGADPKVVRVVRSNPLKWNKHRYFDHTFSCEKGLVEQQQQSDNVGGRLSELPLTKSWIRLKMWPFPWYIQSQPKVFGQASSEIQPLLPLPMLRSFNAWFYTCKRTLVGGGEGGEQATPVQPYCLRL